METKQVETKTALVFKTKTSLNNVSKIAMSHMPKMYQALAELGLEEKEPSVFIYRGAGEDMEKEIDFEIALITDQAKEIDGPYSFESLQTFKCLSNDYKGSLKNIDKKYKSIFEDIAKANIFPTDEVREVYHNWIGEDAEGNEVEIQVGLN